MNRQDRVLELDHQLCETERAMGILGGSNEAVGYALVCLSLEADKIRRSLLENLSMEGKCQKNG